MGTRFQDIKERDLFQAADKKIRKKTRTLLPRLRKSITFSYENIIFFAIALVMSCVIFFSLGVEKGRRDIDRAREKTARPSVERRVEQKIDTKSYAPRLKVQYIIHLVAFKNKESVEKELAILKGQGHTAEVKRSGLYYQLYLGGFSKKLDAQRLLKGLKKRYKDCYIKKIEG